MVEMKNGTDAMENSMVIAQKIKNGKSGISLDSSYIMKSIKLLLIVACFIK